MKKIKILYAVGLVILALIVIVAIAIGIFADSALKTGIETIGTKTLKVPVSLGKANLSILAGKLDLQNLVIDNPEKYQNKEFLNLKDAGIQVNIKSLLTDTVKIKQIKLDGMDVVLEQSLSGNNIQDILKALPAAEKTEEEAPAGKKLVIENLELSNIAVKVKLLPIPGKSDTVTLKLAPITMTNLGSDGKMDTSRLISKILVAITEGIAQQGADLLPTDLINPLKDQLKNVAELSGTMLKEGGEVLKEGADIGKGAIKGGTDVGKQIGEGLKGLFKSKEEDK